MTQRGGSCDDPSPPPRCIYLLFNPTCAPLSDRRCIKNADVPFPLCSLSDLEFTKTLWLAAHLEMFLDMYRSVSLANYFWS